MVDEEKIIQALITKFSFLDGNAKCTRPRRIFLELNIDRLFEVVEYLCKDHKFAQLCTITGLDEGDRLSMIYHLAQNSGGLVLNVKTWIPKENPVIKTMTHIYPNAEIYERELIDLLGFKVDGLPQGIRYPLPDNWPNDEFPLRKDWKAGKK